MQHHPGTCREHSPFDPRIPAPARLRLPANVTSLRSAPRGRDHDRSRARPLPHSSKSRQPRGGAAIQGGGAPRTAADPRGWGGRGRVRDLRLPEAGSAALGVAARRSSSPSSRAEASRHGRTPGPAADPADPGGDSSYPFHPFFTPHGDGEYDSYDSIYRRGRRDDRAWRSERLFSPGDRPGRAGGRRPPVRRRWRVANDRTRRQGNGQGRSDDELFEHLEQMRKKASNTRLVRGRRRCARGGAAALEKDAASDAGVRARATRASPSTCIAARIRRDASGRDRSWELSTSKELGEREFWCSRLQGRRSTCSATRPGDAILFQGSRGARGEGRKGLRVGAAQRRVRVRHER